MAGDQQAAKQHLRAGLLAARDRRSATERASAGESICRHVLDRAAGLPTVALYLSLGSEPPTHAIVDALHWAGTQVLLPVITGDGLDWAAYIDLASVQPGPLGISEPTGARLGPRAVLTADLIVVPALAVDRAGHRLGRGRGYYDRALGGVTAPVMTVVFDDEVLDEVPTEPHDRAVDAVVTPSGAISLGA